MDKAFEKARAAYGTGAYDDATLEFIFPELKESEDERNERMRNRVIESLVCYRGKVYDEGDKEVASMVDEEIIWMRKQKEQKPAEVDESTKRLNDNWMKQHFDDYEEQKSAKSREEILHQLFQNGTISLSDYLYLTGEQKPAEWSEEDEKMLNNTLDSLKRYQLSMPNFQVELQMRWLKSLRPQHHKWYIKKGHWYMCIVDKPEYGWTKGKVYQSPEDNRIETNYKGSLTNWPDSEPWFRPATHSEIPDNQPHWKPSEEQMEALLWCTAHLGGADHRVLAELYEHLKMYCL